MIAAYVRVSSASQKTHSQKSEIESWLARNNYNLEDVQWFEDIQTGKSIERPAMDELQKGIFSGEIKTVIVWKLDRLARNFHEGVDVICDWCKKDVRVISVTQQIDLNGTLGRMVAGVLFAFAEIELQHIKERQMAGIAIAKEKGLYTGRNKGTTKGNPERAWQLKKKGFTVKEIATGMGVSESTVWNYLREEKLKISNT